ncbi:response regulator [Rhodanobacter sp. AS-Z3]|uniref:response regulator n=1 Tax=Rhodanobacter sp. AS-Z3 TaxID=3031330 RepID=UPI00247B1A31|nr:response regulator [Rhodanobacter sp. AS-Z3]WEN13981.1 response regulator [Rhodanobacter sp. AS-Z3]
MSSRLANTAFEPVSMPRPRVLVADDDPGSCRFLRDGLSSMGAEVEACLDGSAALQRATSESFDLLLLDCRMPGAGALQILQTLRADVQACSADSMAVATSAELAAGMRQSLLDAGFSEVLLKPCGLTELRTVLALVPTEHRNASVLDDQAALNTTGDVGTMRALRLLLREELALLQRELDTLSRDPHALSERLHRLRSSCGFCGARALSRQTVLLQQQLQQAVGGSAALTRFRRALLATLQALDA